MEKIDVEAFKKEGFSFEEIESVKLGIEQMNNGETISKDELNSFIKNELFSKYTLNV